MKKPKVTCPVNCSKCGRFVGKKGFMDLSYDYYNGGWEMGYPLCESCLEKERKKDKINVLETQENPK